MLYNTFNFRYGRVVRRRQTYSIKSPKNSTFLITTIPGIIILKINIKININFKKSFGIWKFKDHIVNKNTCEITGR